MSDHYFRVKELGWCFGMWFGEDVTLFAQHENNIDKFKPSYSAWCAETPREKVLSGRPLGIYWIHI